MKPKVRAVSLVLAAFLLTAILMPVLGPAKAFAAGQIDFQVKKEIEENLICQDGCGMILSACENQTAEYMRKIIVDRLTKGQSKAEIMSYFVSIYGDKVLAAPPAKGFNITAWVTPFIALLGGILLVYFFLEKWIFNGRLESMEQERETTPELPDLSEYEDKLDEELKKYL